MNLPLSIPRARKTPWVLNLNVYRKTHYIECNRMKKIYEKMIVDQLYGKKQITEKNMVAKFNYFAPTKAIRDISNACCIIDKFTLDAIVHFNVIPDDNYKYIQSSFYHYAGLDRENPRCELELIAFDGELFTGH